MSVEYLNTFDEGKGKDVVCGYIQGDTYYREVKNLHFMIKYSGYGIQTDILSRLVKDGISNIVITTERGTVHHSKLLDWVKNGKKGNYDHGDQIFLSTKYMEKR